MATSKDRPHYKREAKITKVKFENNISYFEARNLLPKASASYASAAKRPTTSVGCQTDSNLLLAAIPKLEPGPSMAKKNNTIRLY